MTKSQENYQEIIHTIKTAASESGRKPTDVTLIAVTKTFLRDDIEPVLTLGHKIFGENKVQEAYNKWVEIKKDYPDIKLHLIGPLQTNKTAEAIALFDVIETVDREKLAQKIAEELVKTPKNIELMIQINTGEEPQKAGIIPQEADNFIEYCLNDLKLPIKGLMCIPPFEDEPSPHFAFLSKIARKHNLSQLSMGMSGDYKIAVKQGATYVRVGSAIFGTR
ncbi:MAG: YggS family pyridoxal phosphate-dependent enzyme [Alphaproteobacteria bacterium]